MVTVYRRANANWKIAVYGAEGRHAVEHYHVEGPGFRCSVDIMTGELIVGEAPKRILAEARAWANANREILLSKYEELNQ
jgi:hypothetical protein